MMKVWYCYDFKGYYPVGTALIVVAPDIDQALMEAEAALSGCGLPQTLEKRQLKRLDTKTQKATILVDGNY